MKEGEGGGKGGEEGRGAGKDQGGGGHELCTPGSCELGVPGRGDRGGGAGGGAAGTQEVPLRVRTQVRTRSPGRYRVHFPRDSSLVVWVVAQLSLPGVAREGPLKRTSRGGGRVLPTRKIFSFY